LGEVSIETGSDTTDIPLVLAPDVVDTIDVTTDKLVRTKTFSLSTGNVVNAGCYFLSDSESIARLTAGTAIVHYTVSVVDSVTGLPVMQLYNFSFGNGTAPSPPDEFPGFTYVGMMTHAHSYVRVKCEVTDRPDSMYGNGVVVVHVFGGQSMGEMAKRVAPHSAGRFGNVPNEINPINLHVAPNPFNPRTTALWDVPQDDADDLVDVRVYDMNVNEVAHPVHDYQSAGKHQIDIDGSTFPSGRYIISVHTARHQQSKLMILAR
jgi:hypothetical protein